MKAAVLRAFGTPLTIENWPDPVLGTGEVIVDVVACDVLTYSEQIFSGARKFLLTLPVIPGPGAIGRVRSVGPDATRLQAGDWVYCDATIRSRDSTLSTGITLQGLSAGGEGGLHLQRYFGHGGWAEQVRVPTENAIPIGPIEMADAPCWCALGTQLVPFGGLLAAGLRAGETLVVSGATGNFGSAAVAVALAMGAGCVVATGRNAQALAALAQRFGPRVRTAQMTGVEEADRAQILQTAPGPIDCVFDILPPEGTATQVRAALMTVRQGGRVVLMGGVGTLGGADLELPYRWIMRNDITILGKWMYPPRAVGAMVQLIRAGLVQLNHYAVTTFSLDQANEAVAHAAANAAPMQKTVIRVAG